MLRTAGAAPQLTLLGMAMTSLFAEWVAIVAGGYAATRMPVLPGEGSFLSLPACPHVWTATQPRPQ